MCNMKWSLLFLVVFIAFFACTDKADLDSREKSVVVYCVLMNDSIQTVNLRYTSYLSESSYPYVEDADVYITCKRSDNQILEESEKYVFHKKGSGEWVAEFRPVAGAVYELFITIPNYGIVTGETKFPEDEFLIQGPLPHNTFTGYNIFCNGVEKPEDFELEYEEMASFYPFRLYASSLSVNDSNAVWIYGMDYDWDVNQFRSAEFIYSDFAAVEKFNLSDITGSQIAEFQKHGNDISVQEHFSRGIPMFYATSSTYYNKKNERFYHRYLRVPCDSSILVFDEHTNGEDHYVTKWFQITPNFKQFNNGIAHPKSHIVAELVSGEYDKYLKSLLIFELGLDKNISSSDMTHLYDYREIYTNINNGLGVFGACNRKCCYWANPPYIWYHTSEGNVIRYRNEGFRGNGDASEDDFIIKQYYR